MGEQSVTRAKNLIEVWLRVYNLKWDGPPTWEDLRDLAYLFAEAFDADDRDLRAKLEQSERDATRLNEECIRLADALEQAEQRLSDAGILKLALENTRLEARAQRLEEELREVSQCWKIDQDYIQLDLRPKVRRLEEALRKASSHLKRLCAGGEMCREHVEWDVLLGDAMNPPSPESMFHFCEHVSENLIGPKSACEFCGKNPPSPAPTYCSGCGDTHTGERCYS